MIDSNRFNLTSGAEEGTRTPTPLRVRGPEPRASANSATSARDTNPALSARSAASLSLAKAGYCVKSRGPAHRLRNALLRRIQNRRSGHFGKVNLSSAFQRFKLLKRARPLSAKKAR